VRGEQQGAVHVPAAQEPLGPLVRAFPVGQHQHELGVDAGQFSGGGPHERAEVRVVEHLRLRLGHEHRDRASPPGHQCARGLVRLVAQLQGGGRDGFVCFRAHPGRRIEHPGRGRPGHARHSRDVLERRACPGQRSTGHLRPPTEVHSCQARVARQVLNLAEGVTVW
jgi:hypothetical protein